MRIPNGGAVTSLERWKETLSTDGLKETLSTDSTGSSRSCLPPESSTLAEGMIVRNPGVPYTFPMTDLQPLLLRPSFLRINLHPLSPSHSRDPNRDRSRAAHPISSEQGNDFVTSVYTVLWA
ncbi:hypothetical protein RRG08_050925 [Elysia crispata]|uniref:Uncharacterized protein n=1 Tax=Elysia crispata TaxID=231223 RepID=A0AAE0YQ60_9GAST|nr:hypothetical protein RRG08_050925 [Elysia crispata]